MNEQETPNLELYESLHELGELGDDLQADGTATEDDRERARELADNVLDVLDDAAEMYRVETGKGTGKPTIDDLRDLAEHCDEVAAQLGFPRAADGARILIGRWETERAHLAGQN